MKKTIKVLVIDDSLIFREGIRRILNEDPALEVVGTAADVFMACQMIETLQPDVLTLDIEMPRMNGIEFLKRLMAQHPLPVIIVSSLSQGAFDAIREGAVDFVIKPAAETGGMASLGQELRLKVKIASMARVGSPARLVPAGPTGLKPQAEEVFFSRVRTMRAVDLIVIGASTGGTEAVSQILSGLASDMPPILIVQHMMPLFTRLFAERLDKVCALTVREAQGRLPLERGQVIIAAGEQHLQVRREGRHLLAVSQPGERVNGHCPAVDVLFHSVSQLDHLSAIAVLLTGMGYDGARGLMELRRTGALTIGQDEASSVVYGMPKVAFDLGGVEYQAAPEQIASMLSAAVRLSGGSRI